MALMTEDAGEHIEHEDHPWDRAIPDHPPRSDSAAYRASRRALHKLVDLAGGCGIYGKADASQERK
jgi:hypothetical protein